MKEVVYAGGSFVTGDAIADALMEYAAELANAERAATVHVPALGALGEELEVSIVIGPASQLLSTPSDNPGREPEGRAFAEEVHRRVEELHDRTRSMNIPSSGIPSSVPWDV